MAPRSNDSIVRVLLVDHESKCGFTHDFSIHGQNNLCACLIAWTLQQWSFQVTMVDGPTAGLYSLLCDDDKEKFDVVMENMNSSDESRAHPKVLDHAVSKGLIAVLVSDDHNGYDERTMYFLQKPVSETTLKCLCDYVSLRMGGADAATIPKPVVNESSSQDKAFNNNNNVENDDGAAAAEEAVQVVCDDGDQEKVENRPKKRPRRSTDPPLVWTRELHEKFENALLRLGDGKCFPKEILRLMNVPGLTRFQVASHLQKCRYKQWSHPEERAWGKRGRIPFQQAAASHQLPHHYSSPSSSFWLWNQRRGAPFNLPGRLPPGLSNGNLQMLNPWGPAVNLPGRLPPGLSNGHLQLLNPRVPAVNLPGTQQLRMSNGNGHLEMRDQWGPAVNLQGTQLPGMSAGHPCGPAINLPGTQPPEMSAGQPCGPAINLPGTQQPEMSAGQSCGPAINLPGTQPPGTSDGNHEMRGPLEPAVNIPGIQPPEMSDGALEMQDPWGLDIGPFQQWFENGGPL